jgi:hypothetical protein
MKPAPAPNVPGLKAEQELKQEKAKGRDSKKSA